MLAMLAVAMTAASCRSAPKPPPVPALPTVTIGDGRFNVEVVNTAETRRVGMGGRASLPEDRGMLFVYPRPHPPRRMGFWMKDCLIDLDIAFISADRKIVTIHTMRCEPKGTADRDLPHYGPTDYVQFALELAGGQLAKRGIKEGDPVVFSPEIEQAIARAEP